MAFAAIDPYADETYADAMIASEYPDIESDWDALTSSYKLLYLRKAADKIDALPLVGWQTDSEQDRQFPRGGDTTTPDDILRANVIIALNQWYMFDSKSTVSAFITTASREVLSESMGDASFTYSGGSISDWLANGYPLEAIELLRYYILNPRHVSLSRGGGSIDIFDRNNS